MSVQEDVRPEVDAATVTRAEVCIAACADAWRGDGEILASPMLTVPTIAARTARATFEPDLLLSDGERNLPSNRDRRRRPLRPPPARAKDHRRPSRQGEPLGGREAGAQAELVFCNSADLLQSRSRSPLDVTVPVHPPGITTRPAASIDRRAAGRARGHRRSSLRCGRGGRPGRGPSCGRGWRWSLFRSTDSRARARATSGTDPAGARAADGRSCPCECTRSRGSPGPPPIGRGGDAIQQTGMSRPRSGAGPAGDVRRGRRRRRRPRG